MTHACDQCNEYLKELQAAKAENANLLAANKDCLVHFEAIKHDYDTAKAKIIELRRDHAAALEYDTRVINLLRAKLKIVEAALKNAEKQIVQVNIGGAEYF